MSDTEGFFHESSPPQKLPRQIGEREADPLSEAVALRDASIIGLVAQAILESRVLLAYQPVVKAQDPSQIYFFESFARILEADGRPIPAREFAFEVEDTELGREIDCQAVRMGILALKAEPTLRLSVNMSARSIGYRKWSDTLAASLGGHAEPLQRLTVEFDEASVVNTPELVGSFIAEYRPKGVTFTLDHFGRGMSSFSSLRDLTFDVIKIDQSISRSIGRSMRSRLVFNAMVEFGKSLDALIVAQNVEEEGVAIAAIECGVDGLQGYLFGAPAMTPPWRDRVV